MAQLAQCPRHRFKWGLFVGLGLGAAAVGAVVWWKTRKKTSDLGRYIPTFPSVPAPKAIPPPETPEPPPDDVYPGGLLNPTRANPTIRSYTLPAPGQDAVRIVSSAERPYMVMLRVVDPPGSFGMFSYDATTLNNATPIPTGENIIIPVGQWQTVPLPPFSAIYGRGSAANVVVSVTGNPVGESASPVAASPTMA